MDRLKVAVVLFDGVEELDFAGPYEVFAVAPQADLFTVAENQHVACRRGLRVIADHLFSRAPRPDVVVVPGGPAARERPDACSAAEAWISSVASGSKLILSVCTGAFLLARTGLLEGLEVTTHIRRREMLASRHPGLRVRPARVLDSGRIISTAGVTAGLDGSLHALSRLFGPAQARLAARGIEYPWRPQVVVRSGAPDTADDDSPGDWARAMSAGSGKEILS